MPAEHVGTTDLNASKEAREQMEGGSAFWTPEGGDGEWKVSLIRILPPHVSMGGKFYHPAAVHFRVGGQVSPILCPRRTTNGRCPMCEQAFALNKDNLKEEAREFWPSWVGYMNIVVLKDDGIPKEEKIRVWSTSQAVLDQLLALLEDEDVGDFTSLDHGRVVRVRRKWKTKDHYGSDYVIQASPKQTAFDYPDIIEDLNDLTKVAPALLTPETILSLMSGNTGVPTNNPFEKQEALPAPAVEGEVKQAEEDEWVTPAGLSDNTEPADEGKPKKTRSTKPKAPSSSDPAEKERLKSLLG